MKTSFIFFAFLFLFSNANAELKLPNIFGSQMVLQRDKPVRIWGWAEKEKTVTVSFGGQEKTITSGKESRWLITLDPMEANATGQTLKVKSGDVSITHEGILVGDVWICGGQSNMEWRLRSSRDADVEIPSARYPAIRFIRIEPEGTPEPREDFPAKNGAGTWQICSPETIGDCSGVAYFFGQRLHRRLDVPIGLVNAAWGGTMAQHWVTRETLETLPTAKPYLDDYEAKCQAWIDGGRADGAAKRLASDLEKWETLAKKSKAKGEKESRRKTKPQKLSKPGAGPHSIRSPQCHDHASLGIVGSRSPLLPGRKQFLRRHLDPLPRNLPGCHFRLEKNLPGQKPAIWHHPDCRMEHPSLDDL